MDILFCEKEKRIVRIAIALVRKKLGKSASAKEIAEEMKTCANDGVREIAAIIRDNASKVEPEFQRKTMEEITLLGLWVALHDTGYRDMFFATLDDILKNAVALRKMIRPFVKKPKDWYPNIWFNSKKLTSKLRKEGKISEYEHSIVERQCVPSKHRYDLEKIIKKMQKVD